MRRRWPLVVPIALLTLLVGIAIVATRTEAYTSDAEYYLATVPAEETDREPLDPVVVAQLAPALYRSATARADVAANGFVETYGVTAATGSPVIRFSVDAPSAELAVETINHLVAIGPGLLDTPFGAAAETVAFAVVTPPNVADARRTDDGTYSLTATVSISQVAADRANPFPPSRPTLDWLFTVAQSPQLARQIEEIDSSATYGLDRDDRRTAPIITTMVTASSPAGAIEIHSILIEQLEEVLAELQDESSVRANARTGIRELLPPSEPERTASSVVRALAGVVVLGAGLTMGTAIAADAIVASRRERTRATTGGGPDFADADDGAVPDEPSTAAGRERDDKWPAARRRRGDARATPRGAVSNGEIAEQPAEEPATPP